MLCQNNAICSSIAGVGLFITLLDFSIMHKDMARFHANALKKVGIIRRIFSVSSELHMAGVGLFITLLDFLIMHKDMARFHANALKKVGIIRRIFSVSSEIFRKILLLTYRFLCAQKSGPNCSENFTKYTQITMPIPTFEKGGHTNLKT